jgi:hypothetical protein
LARLRAGYDERQTQLAQRRSEARSEVEQLREALRAELLAKWPELATAGDSEAKAALEPSGSQTAADPRYVTLADLEQKVASIAGETLERTRLQTQIDKIYRLRHLARLEAALQRFGSREVRDQYAQLQQCEAESLDSSDR